MFVGLDKFNSQVEAWFASVKTAVQQSAAGLGTRCLDLYSGRGGRSILVTLSLDGK
jgi:hypothetical protein